jgi:hypothetical protein
MTQMRGAAAAAATRTRTSRTTRFKASATPPGLGRPKYDPLNFDSRPQTDWAELNSLA